MTLINDLYGLKPKKKLKIILDLIIFAFFISGIVLYSWSYKEGFNYCESYYLQNCICIEANKSRDVKILVPESLKPEPDITQTQSNFTVQHLLENNT